MPTLGRQRQVELYEFEASLWDPVLAYTYSLKWKLRESHVWKDDISLKPRQSFGNRVSEAPGLLWGLREKNGRCTFGPTGSGVVGQLSRQSESLAAQAYRYNQSNTRHLRWRMDRTVVTKKLICWCSSPVKLRTQLYLETEPLQKQVRSSEHILTDPDYWWTASLGKWLWGKLVHVLLCSAGIHFQSHMNARNAPYDNCAAWTTCLFMRG